MFILQCCDIDVDSEISEVTQSEPFLLLTGQPGMENSQVFVKDNCTLNQSQSKMPSLI